MLDQAERCSGAAECAAFGGIRQRDDHGESAGSLVSHALMVAVTRKLVHQASPERRLLHEPERRMAEKSLSEKEQDGVGLPPRSPGSLSEVRASPRPSWWRPVMKAGGWG